MINTHEYRGLWWLPEDQGRKLNGTLSITKGQPSLELLSDFGRQIISKSETGGVFSHALEERPRILGIGVDGKLITLEGASVTNSSLHFPGIATSTYGHGVALIGTHFSADETIGFDEISIATSDLNSWTQLSGFNVQVGMEKHKEHDYMVLSKVGIAFQSPDDVEIQLARGERAFIRFHAPSEGLGTGTDHISMRQEASLHLRFGKRADLEHVFKRVGQLRNFLSLAVGRPVSVLSVTGYQDDLVHPHAGHRVPIELFWRIRHNPDPPDRPRIGWEMLFTLPDAKPDVSRVMRSWFARQERLQPVFNLFFGSRYDPDLSIDIRFLLHAQAAETYDYRQRRKPGQDTFAKRIGNVLDRCKTVSNRIVGPSASEREAFIEAVKISRNYYTHYNPKYEKKAASGGDLLLLLVQLRAILEMVLLRELGFPARSIHEILERVQRYAEIDHFKRVVAEEHQDGE